MHPIHLYFMVFGHKRNFIITCLISLNSVYAELDLVCIAETMLCCMSEPFAMLNILILSVVFKRHLNYLG
jgi:hypothetical protein